MSSRKRSRCNSINRSSGERLVIKLAEEGSASPQLAVDSLTLRSCCTCCEGLPADAEVWDISSMLVGGNPVKRSTVVQWLNAVYSRLDDSCYEEQAEPFVKDMEALFELLAFADAVGSRRGILLHCMCKLSCLVVSAKLGQEKVFLATDGCVLGWGGPRRLQLERRTPTQHGFMGDPANDVDQKLAFISSIARQTEQLLLLAHQLSLDSLVTRLHGFITGCCQTEAGLLYGSLGKVFTPRVLEAAGRPPLPDGSEDTWEELSSLLVQPCGFTSGKYHVSQLLQPIKFEGREDDPSSPSPYERYLASLETSGMYGGDYGARYGGYGRRASGEKAAEPKPTRFTARLTRDFMGAAAGEEVSVELNVFGAAARIGHVECRAQLLLGPLISDAADADRIMDGGPPQPQLEAQQEVGDSEDDDDN